ncbi:unnamed protein product [Rhodiola kirilowii]
MVGGFILLFIKDIPSTFNFGMLSGSCKDTFFSRIVELPAEIFTD